MLKGKYDLYRIFEDQKFGILYVRWSRIKEWEARQDTV